MDLKTDVSSFSRSYKIFARRLEKLNIIKLEDFLFHIPFRYEDFSLVSKIENIQAGEIVTVKGKVAEIKNQYIKKWRTLQRAKVTDETGVVEIVWFNQPYIPKSVKTGDLISISGKVDQDRYKLVFKSPDWEIITDGNTLHTGRLVPIYPETKGISSKWLRRQVFNLLNNVDQLSETLPIETVQKNNLMGFTRAIETVHFPDSLENAQRAKERLAFEEMLRMQLTSLIRKREWKKIANKKPWVVKEYRKEIDKLIKSLPFELTKAQQNAVEDIFNDFENDTAMNRLLEGDVGSGKTIVATIAAFMAHLNGFQTALMAPTEILANQHYKTINDLLKKFDINVELATGSTKKVRDDFNIIVGTHALIHKKVKFKNLGFIVIDEQQRFGVEQRSILRDKGKNPHLLTMTATPIPRTVALTMYGDLDLSILGEMPKGRKLVKTWLVPKAKREGAYKWIEDKVKNGDQVFIVCPFIEESESMATVKAATVEFERLKKDVFPNLKLGLMHGKMKGSEKDKVLTDFKDKKFDILVCTPVVEVGIDVPNATVMVIEEAERFGLAQLHQMRGRVGRGHKESFCLLFTSSLNPQTLERLKSLESVYSGALLSEIDLRLRGPGQLYGTAQHGVAVLKVARFSDFDLIEKTKKEALDLAERIDEFPTLKQSISKELDKKISPD